MKTKSEKFLFFLLFPLILTQIQAKEKQELIQTEKVKFKQKQPQKVEFGDATIMGDFKSPFSSLLNSQEAEFNRNFSEMRDNWRDLMLMSLIHVTP